MIPHNRCMLAYRVQHMLWRGLSPLYGNNVTEKTRENVTMKTGDNRTTTKDTLKIFWLTFKVTTATLYPMCLLFST